MVMSDDLISRSALIEELKKLRASNPHVNARSRNQHNSEITACIHRVNIAETVEAKPVVHGEWIKTFRYMRKNINTGKLEPVYSCDCPICKYHTGNQGVRFNFCPNCGADMRGKKNG